MNFEIYENLDSRQVKESQFLIVATNTDSQEVWVLGTAETHGDALFLVSSLKNKHKGSFGKWAIVEWA